MRPAEWRSPARWSGSADWRTRPDPPARPRWRRTPPRFLSDASASAPAEWQYRSHFTSFRVVLSALRRCAVCHVSAPGPGIGTAAIAGNRHAAFADARQLVAQRARTDTQALGGAPAVPVLFTQYRNNLVALPLFQGRLQVGAPVRDRGRTSRRHWRGRLKEQVVGLQFLHAR